MDETLDAAVRRLFAGGSVPQTASSGAPGGAPPLGGSARDSGVGASAELLRQAMQHYEQARAAQRNEDWAAYGAEMRQLGEILRRLNASSIPR
jgi:uncharacterized membrane protein (UPF0182 family)